jgi:aminoglycoside 3-N-acetyltransferase
MNATFEKILKEVNTPWLMENSKKLMDIELGQTFDHYHAAAQFTAGLIKEAGIKNCEIIEFPADGKTAYQDKRMPLAWRASVGKLSIRKSPNPFAEPVVADYKRHPFHLVKGSVATPPGGQYARIITEDQMFAGQDATGALIMINPSTRPRAKILTPALDLGAIGLITDNLTGRYDTPQGIQWVAACTEGRNWHVQSDDRPFICFSVSPETGDQIRDAARTGEVIAHVECDGERYEGTVPAVTALIPGRQKKELWIFSHLYEPMIDDNCGGVAGSIEFARIIRKLADSGEIPPLEFSLRLVFTMEFYGYAAFTEKMLAEGGHNSIGAMNTDSFNADKLKILMAPPGTPFFGNYLMEKIADEYKGQTDPVILELVLQGMYMDDMFLSDSTIGIPTLWALGQGKWWHNSEQKINILSPLSFSRVVALIGNWAVSVLTINSETLPLAVSEASAYAKKHLLDEAKRILNAYTSGELRVASGITEEIRERMRHRMKLETERLADFRDICDSPLIGGQIKSLEKETESIIADLEEQITRGFPTSPRLRKTGENPRSGKEGIKSKPSEGLKNDKWFDYAASIVPSRATVGFPYDLIAAPKAERVPQPDGIIYGPFANIFSNMDGQKNLQRLIREAEWENCTVIAPSMLKKYITAISCMTDYGYLNTKFKQGLKKKDIADAIRKTGIVDGDLVMVHSSLSSFGRIEGGAETVIDAIIEAVGPKGTVLFPTFSTSFIYFEGSLNKSQKYRPFDKNDPTQVTVGKIPQAFLKRKGVYRSVHPSHSVAGIGPLAEKCLSGHMETDSPTGENSPFSKLLEFKGKILYFGSGLAPTTYLHFLEDEMNLSYLGNTVCRIKDQDGKVRSVMVPKHLPGHRDFYGSNGDNSKFFKKAKTQGLKINENSLGIGKLQVIDVEALHEIGAGIVKEDPNIFLCDSEECIFCSKNKMRR